MTDNNEQSTTENTGTKGTEEQAATAEGVKGPRVVKHIDVRIAEAREDLEKLEARVNRLIAEKEGQDRIASLTVGTTINFEYGRADKRRTMTGTVSAVGTGDQEGKLAVVVGEGFDAETFKISAGDVLFGDAAVDPAA